MKRTVKLRFLLICSFCDLLHRCCLSLDAHHFVMACHRFSDEHTLPFLSALPEGKYTHDLFLTIIAKKVNQKPLWIKPFDLLGSKRFSSMVYSPLITDINICNSFLWIRLVMKHISGYVSVSHYPFFWKERVAKSAGGKQLYCNLFLLPYGLFFLKEKPVWKERVVGLPGFSVLSPKFRCQ
ncbi:MAG: hypothetical protein HYX24_03995 [Candidatus Aenigmarchaeota archaeon]|nr:hypothetical protein [Candidatus Aenigmarchaeota archaeon]